VVTVNFGAGTDDTATGVVVQPDGRIVVGGWSNKAGTYDFAAVRLFANGGLDPSFGTGGFALVGIANTDKAYALAAGNAGTLVLAGVASAGGDDDLGVVRLTADGGLDPGFNGGVGRAFSLGGQEQARAAAVLSDDSILLAGYRGADSIVVRVAPDGTFTDTAFGADEGDGNKFARFDLGGADKALAIVAFADGSSVIGGSATPAGTNRDFVLASVTSGGQLDTTFGGGAGGVTVDFGGADEQATAVLVQPDGRYLLTGFTNAGGKYQFAAARLTLAGALDPSFDTDGKATVALSTNDQAYAAARDAAGRVVVAGRSNGNLAAVRLTTTVGLPSNLLAGGSTNGAGAVFQVPAGGAEYTVTPQPVQFFTGFDRNVRVAVADVTGDGVDDYIGVAGPGAPPLVSIVNGSGSPTALVPAPIRFAAFELTFTGGLYVAAADLDGDGFADVIVTPDEGGGPVVAVYSGAKLAAGLTGAAAQLDRFFGIDDANFRGGARPAAGDVNGDGTPDLIVSAGFGGGPRVAIFDGTYVAAEVKPAVVGGGRLRADFFAFEDSLRNGAFVAAGDLDGDGQADLVFGGGPDGGPRVRAVSGKALLAATTLRTLDEAPASGFQLANFFAGDSRTRGGVPVAVKDVDGDQFADVIASSGQGLPARVYVYKGSTLRVNQSPPADQQLDVFGNVTLANGVYVG
jgi:uncharacterized delta-60 repeat protein